MFSDLDVLKLYSNMARHASESQRVSAENVARASEAGYKAQAVESFEDFVARTAHKPSAEVASTSFKTMLANTPASPNGNTVSLEQEIFKTADAQNQHTMALSVYSKSIDLLRLAIGRSR